MKVVHIEYEKRVKKTKRELEKEKEKNKRRTGFLDSLFISEYKVIPTKEPIYIVEMSAKEIQLVSFYLELENRKPIVNVELKTELKKGK